MIFPVLLNYLSHRLLRRCSVQKRVAAGRISFVFLTDSLLFLFFPNYSCRKHSVFEFVYTVHASRLHMRVMCHVHLCRARSERIREGAKKQGNRIKKRKATRTKWKRKSKKEYAMEKLCYKRKQQETLQGRCKCSESTKRPEKAGIKWNAPAMYCLTCPETCGKVRY